MSLNDKLKNAKTTNWLADGLTAEQIHETKKLALIAAKIQLKRLDLGLNQKEFSKIMGVSQGMVSKWESGEYNFTVSTLSEICDKLELDFSPAITNKKYNTVSNFKQLSVSIDLPKHMLHATPYSMPRLEEKLEVSV